jgi:hypothetical protein
VESVGHLNAVERVHAYTNPDTRTPDLVILRIREPDGGKVFYQYQPNPGGGFIKGAPPKPLPLYNRTKLRAAKAVVVVEGEKCVEALRAVGVEATTSPGGAKNAKHADWRPLAGLTVYLWPDNDPKTAWTTCATSRNSFRRLTRGPRFSCSTPRGWNFPPRATWSITSNAYPTVRTRKTPSGNW